MAAQEITVVLKGEAADLVRAFNEAGNAAKKTTSVFQKTEKELKSISDFRGFRNNLIKQRDALASNETQLSSFNRKIAQTEATISRMSNVGLRNNVSALGRASRATKRYASSSGSANFAVLSLSQGVQDASFGFIGIQNNITQLTQSFTELRRSTGSTKAAFKAFGATMLGPSGILLGISLITTAILVWQKNSRKAKRETKELNDAVKNLKDSLQSVADTQGNATINSANQIAKLRTLYSISTDVTRSMKERTDAAGKLQTAFSGAFGSIDKLNIIAGDASDTFDKLTQNILDAAKATAAFQEIVKNLKAIGKAQKEIDNARDPEKLKKLSQNYIKAQKAFLSARGGTGILAQVAIKRGKDFENARKALNDYSSGFSKYLDIISDAKDRNKELIDSINGLDLSFKETNNTANKTNSTFTNTLSILEKLAEQIRIIKANAKIFGGATAREGFVSPQQVQIINAYADALKQLIQDGKEGTQVFNQLRNTLVGMTNAIAPINPLQSLPLQFGEGTPSKVAKIVQNYHDKLAQLKTKQGLGIIDEGGFLSGKVSALSGALSSAVSQGANLNDNRIKSMSEDLKYFKSLLVETTDKTNEWSQAAGIVGGVFENVFSVMANGGDVFETLLKSVQKLIIKLVAAAAAASVLNVITGGAAGGFLKIFSTISGIPFGGAHANGAFVNSPQLAIIGDDNTGGEFILNSDQMKSLVENVSGGTQSVIVGGEIRADGNELLVVLQNTQNRNRRIN